MISPLSRCRGTLNCSLQKRHDYIRRLAVGRLARGTEAILPDIPYVGMTLTIPEEFRPILQENRDLLHGMPAMAAEAIQLWAKDRYRVRILVVVVQQTFGGFLNFHPHLHIMVSAVVGYFE